MALEPKLKEVEESKFFFCLKWCRVEKLWAQCFFVAFSQDSRKMDAQELS